MRTRPVGVLRQEVRDILRAATPTHLHLRERLLALLGATLVFDLIMSVLVLAFERHAKGTAIHGYGDALFWTSAQLLTVSSQMVNPLTTGGRIVDIVLELWGISVVATLAGSMGAFFFHRGQERQRRENGQQ